MPSKLKLRSTWAAKRTCSEAEHVDKNDFEPARIIDTHRGGQAAGAVGECDMGAARRPHVLDPDWHDGQGMLRRPRQTPQEHERHHSTRGRGCSDLLEEGGLLSWAGCSIKP